VSGSLRPRPPFRPVVGFCGSRSLSPSFWPLVSRVVGAALAAGRLVVVGDCAGADRLVRVAAGPLCAVGRVSPPARARFGRGAFVRRSRAVVRAVARRRGFPGSAFVGFVSSPCPAGVVPARSWSSGAVPSGSWSSLALAAGLGVPVFVFWCGSGPFPPPSWLAGRWSPVSSSPVWAGAWRWVPA
jgi:hypothetical protein